MKKILLLTICLCGTVAFAQMPEVDYPNAKLIENGDYEKAEKKIVKDYQSDSNDVLVCYAYYKLLSEKAYPQYDFAKAYSVITRTCQLYESLEDKAKNKLVKKNVTQQRLLYDTRQATERWLQNAIATNNIKSLESFLATCSTATDSQKLNAVKKRNTLEFNVAKAINTVAAYQSFIDKRPDAEEVRIAIQLRNSTAYAYAATTNTIESYQNFIENYPDANEVADATANIHKIAYAQVEETNTIEAYQSFVAKYPTAKELTSAKSKIHQMEYDKAIATNTVDAYQSFINKYPTAAEVEEAKQKIKELEKESGCVTLVVSADGATKTEAINNALRAAVEQTYGTFVSANTEILNDELVKDEIVTISSGNIQGYSEVASITLPEGNTSVTLEVTVSIAKLITYAQSKGSQCEFAGATFGANLRMYEFYKKNEQIVFQNLITQLDALRPVYDYNIEVSDPHLHEDGQTSNIGITVIVEGNEKTRMFNDILEKTILSLAMTEEQVKPLQEAGFKYVPVFIKFGSKKLDKYFFYTHQINLLDPFLRNCMYDYSIKDNNGNEFFLIYCVPEKDIKNRQTDLSDEIIIGHVSDRYYMGCGISSGYDDNPQWGYTIDKNDLDVNYYDKKRYSYGKNFADRMNIGRDYYHVDYIGRGSCFFVNTEELIWRFPEVYYNIPNEEISKITNITITPTKNEATNVLCGAKDISVNNIYQMFDLTNVIEYSRSFDSDRSAHVLTVYNNPNSESEFLHFIRDDRKKNTGIIVLRWQDGIYNGRKTRYPIIWYGE